VHAPLPQLTSTRAADDATLIVFVPENVTPEMTTPVPGVLRVASAVLSPSTSSRTDAPERGRVALVDEHAVLGDPGERVPAERDAADARAARGRVRLDPQAVVRAADGVPRDHDLRASCHPLKKESKKGTHGFNDGVRVDAADGDAVRRAVADIVLERDARPAVDREAVVCAYMHMRVARCVKNR
jgi:hypothetical protein